MGAPVGYLTTLRNDKMYEFVDRLINIALPHVRDFHGVSSKAFDIVNVFFNWTLIYGNLGMPEMGVAGASLATAISKWISFSILVFPYLSRRSLLHLSVKNIHFSRDIITKVVSVGSSSMFRNGLAVVAGILLNDIAGNISDSVLAGVGVCTKIMMFPFSIILGFGSGFQPVAGFNWGAKRYDRVKECLSFASKVAFIGAAAMAAVLIVFAKPIIVVFAGTDPQMIEIGRLSIILQSIALPIHAWVAVVNMFCSGLGRAKGAMLLATARQGSCFLPIVYPMAWLFKASGVAAVQAVADVLTLCLAIPLIRKVLREVRAKAAEAGQLLD